VQLAAAPHGQVDSPYGDDTFPYLEPGWKWNTDPAYAHLHLDLSTLPSAVGRVVTVFAGSPSFWGFWILNTGLLVPVCAVAVVAAALRSVELGSVRAAAERVVATLGGAELMRFCIPLLVLFPIANVVVFQVWDWDNTKLFVYWQLGAALLAASWITTWMRRLGWRSLGASLALLTLCGSGILAALSMLPLVSQSNQYGSFTWATAADRRLADQVVARTAENAVFLVGDDYVTVPVLTLAGRRAVVGYQGWVFSYGSDLGDRQNNRLNDVTTIYAGCPAQAADTACPVRSLLQRYNVSYVFIGPDERQHFRADPTWWAARFPVVAEVGDSAVYDVRRFVAGK
jgi:uncharacterized membrane protein